MSWKGRYSEGRGRLSTHQLQFSGAERSGGQWSSCEDSPYAIEEEGCVSQVHKTKP